MRNFFSLLILFTFSSSALADWFLITEKNPYAKFDQYVEMSSLKRGGDYVRGYALNDYRQVQTSQPQPYLSQMFSEEFNCKEDEVTFLNITTYSQNMARGKIINESGPIPKQHIPPGSVLKQYEQIFCLKK